MRPVGDFDLIIAKRRTSVLGPPLLRNMRHSWRESERVYENMYRKFKKKFAVQKNISIFVLPKTMVGSYNG